MTSKNSTIVYQLNPALPFEAEYPLTLADIALAPPVNSRYLLCYEGVSDSADRTDLVDRLKKSLQSFLREPKEGVLGLPEILGKIHSEPSTGRPCVKVIKSSSIRFVVSHRNDVTYKQLEPENGFPMRLLRSDIFATGLASVPTPDRNGGVEGFSIQVTFVEGGFVICVSKHHFVLDGNAVSNLIKWWFKKARSYSTEQRMTDVELVPESKMMALHDKSSLLLERQVEPQEHLEWKSVPGSPPTVFGVIPPSKTLRLFMHFLPNFMIPKIDNAIFHLRPSALRELHADISKHANIKISTNDAVCALLWRCLTRARLCAGNAKSNTQTSWLAMAVNGRRKLSPPLADEYFGNCVFFAPSSVPIPILTSDDPVSLSNVAVAIRESLSTKTSDTWLRSSLQLAAAQSRITDMVMAFKFFMGNDLMVTSWERYFDSLEDLDVGCGAFQRLRLPDGGAFDGMVMVLPVYGMRDKAANVGTTYPGGLEISVDLLHAPMELLKADGEWMRYAQCVEA